MKSIIQGSLRVELMELLANHYPFTPEDLSKVFESTDSLDELVLAAHTAATQAIDICTARDLLDRLS